MGGLGAFGAIATKARVCVDRNRITGGGVTAGIDFALLLASMLTDRATAELIQLAMEYDPDPPFAAGSPQTAAPATLAQLRDLTAAARQQRQAAIYRAAHKLQSCPLG